MLTARRLRERREAALTAANPPAPQSPPLSEAELQRERFRAKQEAARQPQPAKAAEPEAAKPPENAEPSKPSTTEPAQPDKAPQRPDQGNRRRT